MKYIKQLLCILTILFVAAPIFAAQEKSSVDVKSILWGHIKDSYEWHVTNIGDHPVIISLPVIVKTTNGWKIFSSSKFNEEPIESGNLKGYRQGPDNLYIAGSGKYERKIVEIQGNTMIRPLDISITKTVCVLFIDAILLLLCVLLPARWCKKHKIDDPAPKGFTGFMHMFIMYIYDDVIKSALGKEADKYAPYLLTCFFFIFLANMMGVVPFPPGGGNLTGNIACTFFLALCTFLITNLTGTKEYWKEVFWPDVPSWLKVPVPIMPFIEFFGIFTKPFALMIRLFANMMAGHAIALSFASIIFIMWGVNAFAGTSMTIVSVAMSIFMMLLEILVCFIQALVFTMLSAVFISLAHVKHEPKIAEE
jgi:F-type H+-transporting ATPase subunit a